MSSFLTGKIFLPLSHFRRARRAAMRPVFEFYQKGLRFRRSSKDWSEEQKRGWILESLRRAVRRTASESVYYRELFAKIGFDPKYDFSFEDFARLPVLERADIHRAGKDLISQSLPADQMLKDATGGSTGAPTEIWLGPEERGWAESGLQFSFEKIGVPAGAKTAYFWGHHLDPKASDSFLERLRSFAMNVRYFDCFRLSPEILHKYHEEFERFAPDCIVAYASALGQLAEFLKEQKIRPRNYPRMCFVTGAEKLYPAHRQVIGEVFGSEKPVYERYGGRDFGGVGIQTNPAENLDFEIDWAWALVEPETAEENSPILVTKLHADAMPMIRYRVGDNGRFPGDARPGHPTFVLCEVTGRILDRIWLPDGKWVSGAELPHLLKSFAVSEYSFVQSEDYSVELQIVPKKNFNEVEKQEILRIIESNLENLPLKISLVESIERTRANKLRPVITRVNRNPV